MTTDAHACTYQNPFVKRLVAAGVIPPQCTKFTLQLEVDHVIKATAEYLVTTEQLEVIARAATENPDAVLGFAKEHIFKNENGDHVRIKER